MREYGQVQSSFWQSNDAQGWSDAGKLLAIYLLTGPHANGIGCYRCPDGYVMADLGWPQEKVADAFDELSRNGFANRFDMVVFIPNFLRWNRVANGNIAKARLFEFDALPKGRAKMLAARALLDFVDRWEPHERTVLETVCQTLSEGYANQNPTQPNPERKDILSPPDGGDPATELVGKKEARRTQIRRITAEAVDAYNAILGKPNGKLTSVHLVNETRHGQVNRCLPTAAQICEMHYGSPEVVAKFWTAYFEECDRDPFKRGDGPYGGGHENWRPDFEYLTRRDVMTAVFDSAMSRRDTA